MTAEPVSARRGPRPYCPPTVEDLRTPGPPIRVRALAALAGFSKMKIMADADGGHLRVEWVPCGTRRMATVDRAEAVRYLVAIGVLKRCSTGNTANSA